MSTDIRINDVFNALDADIILRSAAIPAEMSPTEKAEVCEDFRVHKQQLAQLSVVFRDMLEVGTDTATAHASDLPVIQLEEGAAVIGGMLRYTSADVDFWPDMADISASMVIALWNAALKYQIPALQYATETDLLTYMNAFGVKDCSNVFATAVNFNRVHIRTNAVSALGRFPITKWPTDLLSSIYSSGLLLDLLRAKKDTLADKLPSLVNRAWQMHQPLPDEKIEGPLTAAAYDQLTRDLEAAF